MESFFDKKLTLRERFRKHQIGIYVTIIVHLLAIIFLLAYQINDVKRGKMAILLDFSQQESKEREEKQLQEKEERKAEVERMFNDARAGRVLRNVAVNTQDAKTSTLKDDKGINESVYDDARRLQEKIDANREKNKELQVEKYEAPKNNVSKNNSNENKSYDGPTVLSYTLEGWRATYLPVPVYKCPGGGNVAVIITIDQDGRVSDAKIDESVSTANDCLYEAARRAAKSSRFKKSGKTPIKQVGNIVYQFVAQ